MSSAQSKQLDNLLQNQITAVCKNNINLRGVERELV